METPWMARVSKRCLSSVIPRNILGAPGEVTPCLARRIATCLWEWSAQPVPLQDILFQFHVAA